MVRLRVDDPTLASELLTFLRRCECDVDQLGPETLEVGLDRSLDLQLTMHRQRVGDGHAVSLGDGPVRDEWVRMEIEAYLKVWCALHPGCGVELLGARAVAGQEQPERDQPAGHRDREGEADAGQLATR